VIALSLGGHRASGGGVDALRGGDTRAAEFLYD